MRTVHYALVDVGSDICEGLPRSIATPWMWGGCCRSFHIPGNVRRTRWGTGVGTPGARHRPGSGREGEGFGGSVSEWPGHVGGGRGKCVREHAGATRSNQSGNERSAQLVVR